MTDHSVTAIIGANGDGKTLCATAKHAMPSLRRGRPVVANYTINHPLARMLNSYHEIAQLRHCTLILDEISSAFPSRQAMSLPPDLVRLLHQMRKPDVDVVWTAVNWSRADSVLREATNNVTICKGKLNDKWQRENEIPPFYQPNPKRKTDDNGKPLRRTETWKANRLFTWKTYDARAFDEFSIHVMKTLRPQQTDRYWRPWHDDDWMYDTMQEVPMLDNMDDIGPCPNCGGTRRRPACHCKPSRAPRVTAGPPPEGPADDQDATTHA